MKYLTQTSMIAVLVLATALICSAQSKEAEKDKKRFKHDEKIETEYDSSSDQSTLKLQMTPITCVREACIFFSLETAFSGRKVTASPDRFVLALYIFTKVLKPFSDRTLVAAIDGELTDLGEMTFAGEESKDGLTGMAYGIILDEKALAKLAKARQLAMRLGGLQFPLGEKKVIAIADFYSRATPGP